MLSDILYALRALRHHPSFALVAVLSIALGIGANSVMFSLADAVLLRPLPVPHPARVVNLRSQLHGQPPANMSYPDFLDFQRRSKAFAGLTAMELNTFGFAPDKQRLPEMQAGWVVSGNFFDVLEIAPRLGRTFLPDEDAVPGRDAVAVLSYDLWRNEFSSSPDVIGRSLFLNGIEFKIIGVAPESFTGVDQYFRPALYVPLMMSARLTGNTGHSWLESRDDHRLFVKGRLRPGVSAEAAGSEARVIAVALAKAYPDTNQNRSAAVRTEMQARLDTSPYDALMVAMLLGLAGIVLLIACANVANLMLSRALARSGEIAIRMAIGAGRWRLVRQLLTESLLVSLVAGGAGLFLAALCMDAIVPWRIPSEIPIEISARLDLRVALYAFCASLASCVVCGLLPAFRATQMDIESALRAGGRNIEPRRRFFGRNALVVGQVAGSLFLLVCATQLYRGISFLLSKPPGFRSDHILMASFDPTLARYDDARIQSFYKSLTERAGQLPGAVSASVAELVPMSNHPDEQLIVPEGYRLAPGTESVRVFTNVVSRDYFSTLDIPILRGRAFRSSDTAESPRVAVVNQHFARTFFPNQDPIGKRFRLWGASGPWVEIAGLARGSKYMMLMEPPLDFVYLPLTQNHRNAMTLLVRTVGSSESLAAPLRDLVRSLDSDQPLFALRTMEQYFRDRATRLLALLTGFVGGMGLLGLILALSGIYAVMAWSVARRIREIGIRMAVGASRVNVLGLILKQGFRLSVTGIAIGIALSLAFGRALTAGMGAPSLDVPIVVVVSVALLAMAAAGAYVPARRASKLDPITVLRHE